MKLNLRTLRHELIAGLKTLGAPSIQSAVRADAELLVNLCIEHRLDGSDECLSKYLEGVVSVEVVKVNHEIFSVYHYFNGNTKHFAHTVVTLEG